MAPMPLTGTIGATATGHEQGSGGRRALPDQVTTFFLPTVKRPQEAQPPQPVQRGRKSREAAKNIPAAQSQPDESEKDLLNVEQSLILLQSLRQSRLAHLTAFLPYLSTRHRTSTRYHAPPEHLPFPGGLDASVRPPALFHLGRADVRIGPFVFPKTRFGEARVEGGILDVEGAASMKGVIPKPIVKQQPATAASTPTQSAVQSPAIPQSSPKSVKATETLTPRTPQAAAEKAAIGSPRPPTPAAAPTTPTSNVASTSATAAPAPPAKPPAPAINDKVVKAVSAAAHNNPPLQALLHVAANGKATPDQLRELSAFISKMSAAVEKAEKAAAALQPSAGLRADGSGPSSALSSPAKSPAKPKKPRKKRKSAEDDKSTAAGTTIPASLSAPLAPSPYPPIVTVEYRENPSARFVLPLWRDAAVERRIEDGERTIKVTMLLPAIGSSAALRAAGYDAAAQSTVDKSSTKKTSKKAGKGNKQQAQTADTAGSDGTKDKAIFSPMNPPTKDQLRVPAPKGAETRAMTWVISGTSDGPLSDGIWDIFGRVEGAQTFVDGVLEEAKGETGATESQSAVPSEQALYSLIAKLRALPLESHDTLRTPKLRLAAEQVPRDLAEQLSDKFAPRLQTLATRPNVRFKRGGGEDDIDGWFTSLGGAGIDGTEDDRKRKRVRIEGDDDSLGDTSMRSPSQLQQKRKRHVATHNADGTIKCCRACGKTTTPMWRRGPYGSTLCNACGAKWKAGRLVVPDQPPAPVLPQSQDSQSTSAAVEEKKSEPKESSKATVAEIANGEASTNADASQKDTASSDAQGAPVEATTDVQSTTTATDPLVNV